jgi:hypothetical protein
VRVRGIVGLMKFSHGWMSDTNPEALRIYLDINHRMAAQQKLQIVAEMYETMMATYAAQERKLHPEADDREIFLRVAARRLGPAVVKRVYGWNPDELESG